MSTYLIGLVLLSLAAVIDASVMPALRLANGNPSLVLILVVAWGLQSDLSESLTWAVMGGIALDLLSVTPTGTSSLAYTITIVGLAYGVGQVGRRNLAIPPLAAVLATVIWHVVILLVLTIMDMGVPLLDAFLTWTLPSAAYNALGMLVVFRVMGGIIAFFRPPQVRL